MARWLVTQVDRQFSAADLEELKSLASRGELSRGDMIQPPGASDWLYAVELPELKSLLPAAADFDDEFDKPRSGVPTAILAIIFILMSVGGAWSIYHYAVGIKTTSLELLEELALTEMLVTAEGVTVRSGPEASAGSVGGASKDEKVQLLAKRNDFYRIRTKAGVEGWVQVNQVVPAYFFTDAETREDYDPLYNPDNYVFVKNASWMQTPDQRADNRTLFNFQLQNKSKFDMEHIVLVATIKDSNGKELEKAEIAIEGKLKRFEAAMVGTLNPDRKADPEGEPRRLTETTFQEMLKEDPSLQERWVDSIEVTLGSDTFEQASVDLLEVRAIPQKLD
jgi:hypothetical protein